MICASARSPNWSGSEMYDVLQGLILLLMIGVTFYLAAENRKTVRESGEQREVSNWRRRCGR